MKEYGKPSNNPPQSKCRTAGFTLVEVLISSAILIVVALGAADFFSHQSKSSRTIQVVIARNTLVGQLSTIIRLPNALANTATQLGGNFSNCVLGSTMGCNVPAGAASTPINLFDAQGAGNLVAGGATPVYYNLGGTQCTPAVPPNPLDNCVLQATASYIPDCGAAASCNIARAVRMAFTVSETGTANVGALVNSTSFFDFLLPLSQVGGAGTADYVPVLSTNGVNGNSVISQPGYPANSDIVIGSAANPSQLIVNGSTTVNQNFVTTGHFLIAGDVTATNLNIQASMIVPAGQWIIAPNIWVGPVGPPTAQGTVFSGTLSATTSITVPSSGLGVASPLFFVTSDRNLKSDINPIDDVEARVDGLRGVSFRWKSNQRPGVGFIAQEVEKVFPELVSTQKDGMKAVEYGNVIGALLEAFKASTARHDQLMKEQEQEIAALRARLSSLIEVGHE